MLYGKTWDASITEYAQSHTHPITRCCHTIGIPLVAGSVVLLLLSIWIKGLFGFALTVFIVGWIFQFIGHAFEKKPPEFFKDWRFLFVGVRWWLQKLKGRI